MNKIHPTAIIEDGAELGTNVEIGPYCMVGSGVKIGNGCSLKSHVVLDGQTTIGTENIFHPFSYVGGEPQDLKYNQEKSLVIIGNKTILREGVSVTRGTLGGGGKTIIGDANWFVGYGHVAHNFLIANLTLLSHYTS